MYIIIIFFDYSRSVVFEQNNELITQYVADEVLYVVLLLFRETTAAQHNKLTMAPSGTRAAV